MAEFPGAVILISHDRAFLSTVTTKIWLLDDKKLQNFEGGYEQVSPYLDALELEREYKEKDKDKDPAPVAPVVVAPVAKPVEAKKPANNKNTQKIDAAYADIEATEAS